MGKWSEKDGVLRQVYIDERKGLKGQLDKAKTTDSKELVSFVFYLLCVVTYYKQLICLN